MEYENCLVELDEVLNYLSPENLAKIPGEIRNGIKAQKSKSYEWKYDETKTLKEQNLNRNTIVLLSYLNSEYLLNEEQKEYMDKLHRINEKKNEKEKIEKYSVQDLFAQKEKSNYNDFIYKDNLSVVEKEKEKWYNKILKCIKIFFNMK
jgi:hypothetical protein